ncbi:aminotransferase class I/II-fold pyridoxal phosphate-dependent enzyme [Ruminococcaceae bacterium OttesenSCG-928-L11]|nr:aminotransferase class I/II-fold pyridoxal phosphate-dependent enzyme [Ruminococcaceae bacterium OttesenSCG-928-L11]
MEYQNLFSRTAAALKPSGIRKFFSLAAEMEDVISLGVGEPDFKTPWVIRKAGIDSLDRGRTWYTANSGLAALQQEITRYLDRRFRLEYEPSQVLVTVGGSEAIDLTIRAFVNPGDEVLLPEPSFVAYAAIVELCGGVVVPLVTKAEDDFRLTADALRAAITDKTKLLIFPFPNNPTGGVMRREHLQEIADVLRDTDIMVLSDEIYAELTFGGKQHVSIASVNEDMKARTVLVNGFSKAYAMTGWRLGYVVAPAPVIDVIYKIHQYAIMCAPTTSQYAAIEALRSCDGEIEKMAESYDKRRRLIVGGLNEMGLECFMPGGAFYAFPSIRSTGMASMEFCEKLLEAERVAVVPGDAFGSCGEGYVRICYAYSVEHITEALTRMRRFLKRG